VLEVTDLTVHLETFRGQVHAVDGVSLVVHRGEAVALVGESGCGKTMTAMTILRLAPSPPARVLGGSVILSDDSDTVMLSESELRRRRGSAAGMMFQDPSTYLNTLIRIGDQIAESLRLRNRPAGPEAVNAVLSSVGLEDSSIRRRYPHELSGGMRQRALLAVAVACEPELLIADEPTTALDVTIQAQVMRLLAELRESGMGILLITHDLPVVAGFCERVYVMYAGQIVEEADVLTIFEEPRHPYTRGLVAASRSLSGDADELKTIEGVVPDLRSPAPGCRFAPRCEFARALCHSTDPPVQTYTTSADTDARRLPTGQARCWIGNPRYEASAPAVSAVSELAG
jgi:oligopeptide/dipeptide ABC transporter ATP-binding protein